MKLKNKHGVQDMTIEARKKDQAKKVAWGITGSGDKLPEAVEVMKKIKTMYQDEVAIQVYLSKAAEHVAKQYGVADDLRANFERVWVEVNSNMPFLSGQLQMGKFEFLLIAPATSNTVAKISVGIADTLLSNSAVMALKAFVPVYIMPSDYKEGVVVTRLPSGRNLKLRVRKEDANNVRKLAAINGVFVLEKLDDIYEVFMKHFGSKRK